MSNTVKSFTLRAMSNPKLVNLPDAAGVLPDSAIYSLMDAKCVRADHPFLANQVQPASLDLRLGGVAYRVRAGFLPSPDTPVADKIERLKLHTLDLTQGAVLERGAVYIIPLLEELNLPTGVGATSSPKSSTGRLDMFTRLLANGVNQFETIPAGYKGQLWLEVVPQTFGILAKQGDRLNQIRFRQGICAVNDKALEALHKKEPLVYVEGDLFENAKISNGLWLSVDLLGDDANSIIAYRAKRHTPLVDLAKIGHYDWEDFWEPVRRPKDGALILNPEDFYILASREKLCVPPEYSAEMVAFDQTAGELRVHYAGFFDPGFGYSGAGMTGGTTAVLEIRAHDTPFVLEHGQRICRMVYEPLADHPEELYGQGIGSNYAGQKLKLAKQFKMTS